MPSDLDTEATEIAQGHRHKECTVCGETIVEDVIPVVVAPADTGKTLSIGLVVAIVAGCSVATGASGCAVAWCVFKRKRARA